MDHNFVIDHLHKIIWIIFEASIFRVSVALGWFFWGPIKTYYPLALSPRTCGWSFPQDGLSWSGGRPTPLKNDGLSQLGWWHSQLIWKVIKFMVPVGVTIPNIWKVIKFHGSKPPTRCWYINIAIQTWWFSIVFCMFTRGTVPNHQPDMGRPRICHQRHQLKTNSLVEDPANSTSQRTAVVREKCLLICEVSPRKMRF